MTRDSYSDSPLEPSDSIRESPNQKFAFCSSIFEKKEKAFSLSVHRLVGASWSIDGLTKRSTGKNEAFSLFKHQRTKYKFSVFPRLWIAFHRIVVPRLALPKIQLPHISNNSLSSYSAINSIGSS